MRLNKVGSERALEKHGGTIVVGERTRGGSGCREPYCTVNGSGRLKPKADSDLNWPCNLMCVTTLRGRTPSKDRLAGMTWEASSTQGISTVRHGKACILLALLFLGQAWPSGCMLWGMGAFSTVGSSAALGFWRPQVKRGSSRSKVHIAHPQLSDLNLGDLFCYLRPVQLIPWLFRLLPRSLSTGRSVRL